MTQKLNNSGNRVEIVICKKMRIDNQVMSLEMFGISGIKVQPMLVRSINLRQ